jgi:hypothetical protein
MNEDLIKAPWGVKMAVLFLLAVLVAMFWFDHVFTLIVISTIGTIAALFRIFHYLEHGE